MVETGLVSSSTLPDVGEPGLTTVVTAPGPLLRAFFDAPLVVGSAVFAAAAPQHVPTLRDWAEEVAAGGDAEVRASLWIDALLAARHTARFMGTAGR